MTTTYSVDYCAICGAHDEPVTTLEIQPGMVRMQSACGEWITLEEPGAFVREMTAEGDR